MKTKFNIMKTNITTLFLLLFGTALFAQSSKVLPKEVQIKMALQVAPEESQANATVYGYDQKGELILLKKGTNNLICLADNPNKEGVKIDCYSTKLEPFMSRGRDLKNEGKSVTEIRDIRKKEVEAGKLQMPDEPSMLYVFTGDDKNLNHETGHLKDGKFRYVIYIPYATVEETGIPAKPHAPGMPWLMDPGTHRAHIMVSTPH